MPADARGRETAHYLLSLPERVIRSASALAGGLVRELGDVALPAAVPRTWLYQTLVEGTLRFLIDLARDFLIRRGAGNAVEMAGLLRAAAVQFSPARLSFTERLLARGRQRK